MPSAKTKRRKTKKGKRSKSRYTSRKLVSMTVPSGMPVQRRACLRYHEALQVTSTSGILGYHVFRANSLFDPDLTGVGHQPMGYDQWASLFNHYIVLGAKLTCMWGETTTASGSNMVVGTYLAAGAASVYSDYNSFIESRKGTHNIMVFPRKPTYTSSKFSCRKFFNVIDPRDNLQRLGAAIDADPNEGAFFHVYAQSLDKSSTNTVIASIMIEYLVEFSEPRDLNES